MAADPVRPRTLTEALRGLTLDELSTLLRHRGDLCDPRLRDLAELANRSTTTASVGRALDQLNAWLRLVAEALAALPDPSTLAELGELVGPGGHSGQGVGPSAVLASAVRELRARALLWGEDDQLHLVRPVREAFEPYPLGLAPPSPRSLSDTEIDHALAGCDPVALAVLERLTWAPVGAVRHADRPVTPDTARTPVEQVLARRLLRPLDTDTVILPREVAWRLRSGRPSEDPVPVEPPLLSGRRREPHLVDRAGAGAAFGLVHDVELVAFALEDTPHRLLRTGGLGTREVAALGRELGTDAAHATFVIECAAAAGLIGSVHNLTVLPTPDFDRWLTLDGAQRWRLLAGSWLGAPRFFARSTETGGHALGPEADAAAAPGLRTLVLTLLAAAGPGTMVAGEDVARAASWHRPRLGRGPLSAEVLVGWTWREAGWLGLLALGAVTSFAPFLLSPGESFPPELAELFPTSVERLVIQADLTGVAPGPLTHEVAADLRLLADQESRGGGGVFRFSAGSLRRAYDAGWSAAQVHGWLARHSSTGVPQPLTYLVDDVARRHGTIRVGSAGCYLRVEDEAQAAAVLAHPHARALGLRAVAPGVLVAAADAAEVVNLLRELGSTPALEDDGGQLVTAPSRQRAARRASDPNPVEIPASEVAAGLLAAERDHPVRRDVLVGNGTDDTLQQLRAATRGAHSVRVAYVAADGSPTERELSPLDLGAGSVRAVDRDGATVVTIPLARISSVERTSPGP